MTHRSTHGNASRFATALTGMLLASSAWAGPGLGFAQTEAGSFMEFTDQDNVLYAVADLDGQQVNVATVSNPFADRSIKVQVRAITGQAAARTLAVELAAGEQVSFDLQAGAAHLLATSNTMFQIEVHGEAADGLSLPVAKLRTGRNPRTNKAAEGLAGNNRSGPMNIKCTGDWTLTCAGGGCSTLGPFTHPGRIVQDIIYIGGRPIVVNTGVYWNLNTPNGNYRTKAPGPLYATWTPGSNDCPVEVTNSLGHTYDVTR